MPGDDTIIAGGDYGATVDTGSVTFTGGAGTDIFKLVDATAAAAAGVFDLDKATSITDFNADAEMVQIATGLANDKSVASFASGAAIDLEDEGIVLITGSSVADFTSEAQAIAAIGNAVTADGDGSDDAIFILTNNAGTKFGVYIFDDAAGALAGQNVAAGDLQLIAVVDYTGTLGTADFGLY